MRYDETMAHGRPGRGARRPRGRRGSSVAGGALALLAALAAGAAAPAVARAQERPAPPERPDRREQIIRVTPLQTGWLGIGVSMESDPAEARVNGRRVEAVTIVIADIFDGSPADSAGIEVGDTLIRIRGERADRAAFDRLARDLKPGDQVTLTLRREGRDREVELIAAERPRQAMMFIPPRSMEIRIDSVRSAIFRNMDSLRAALGEEGERHIVLRLQMDSLRGTQEAIREAQRAMREAEREMAGGVFRFRVDSLQRQALEEARAQAFRFQGRGIAFAPAITGRHVVAGAQMIEMNPGLAEYFGVDGGVLVTEVVDESPAHEAGLRAGDVVTRLNDRPVQSLSDVRAALSAPRERTATMSVIRRGERLTLTLSR